MDYKELIKRYETYDKKDKKKDIRITDEEKRKFDELKSKGIDVVQVLRMAIHHIYEETKKE